MNVDDNITRRTRDDDNNIATDDRNVKKTKFKRESNIDSQNSKNELPLVGTFWLTLGILSCLTLIGVLYYFYGTQKTVPDLHFDQESIINKSNQKKSDYSLKFNHYFKGMSLDKIKELFKPSLFHHKLEPLCNTAHLESVKIPDQYNFYSKYPKCRFDEIQQQSATGYIEVLASVIKSKYCVVNKDKEVSPSIDFLLNCDNDKNGSKAGYLTKVLEFVKKNGVVTDKCYSSLKKPDAKCLSESQIKKCDRIDIADFCFLNNSVNIKKEIFQNGPVISIIEPYLNFLLFDKGIYNFDTDNKFEGKVFVKIVGWGRGKFEGKDTEYWLVESTWGNKWAENGIAKVRMNVKGSSLDNTALAVYPKLQEIKADLK